jgi:crotonobetainyl-CoA:carnitine CoA-transferase CaiB-like acyl-CoA transferase
MKPGNFFCDQNAAVHAAFATLAALRHRERTGEGQHVELAMIEGEFQLLADAYLDFTMNGRERRRTGNAHPDFAPHGIFRCAGEDAWVAIAVEDDAMWRALCVEMGAHGLAADQQLATSEGRNVYGPEIAAAIEAWTRGQDHYAVQQRLQRAGVAAGAALNALELLRDPHVVARDGFEYVETAGSGPTPHPRVAFRMSGTPVPLASGAPPFGNANEAVLDELGIAEDEREALYANGVLFNEPSGGRH